MLGHLLDVSLRALILAGVAVVVLWKRRPAAVQHAVWASVVCGMLALYMFGERLPRLPLVGLRERPVPTPATVPDARAMYFRLAEPAVDAMQRARATLPNPRKTFDWRDALENVYLAGLFLFLARFALGMALAWRLVVRSLGRSGFRESASIAVPLTVGWLRPQILLPIAWRGWDGEKLAAVLAHEGAHIRRRDNLIAGLAAINRAVFWFHPLAWWLEGRLVLLAELACDEQCIAELGDELGDRQRYANLLLEMAGKVEEGRLAVPVFSMAASSHLRRRIDAILEGRAVSRGLSWGARAAFVAGGIPIVFAAGTLSLDKTPPVPPVWMIERPFTAPAPPPPRPILLAQAQTPPVSPAKRIEFEVASIRPAAPMQLGGGGNGRGGGPPVGESCGIPRLTMDAGRLSYACVTVSNLITLAYGVRRQEISGPDWLDDPQAARFDIVAKLPAGATQADLPQLFQALLAERFGLAVHRGGTQTQGYALVVDKGGLKLKGASGAPAPPVDETDPSVCPPQNFNCAPSIRNIGGVQTRNTPVTGQVRKLSNPRIGVATITMEIDLGRTRVEAPGTTLEGLADVMTFQLGSPVTDETGVKGRYEVLLETQVVPLDRGGPPLTPEEATDRRLTAYRKALSNLGLRLEPRKVSVETIVIDHVEKTPTAN